MSKQSAGPKFQQDFASFQCISSPFQLPCWSPFSQRCRSRWVSLLYGDVPMIVSSLAVLSKHTSLRDWRSASRVQAMISFPAVL